MAFYDVIDDQMLACGECPMWDWRNGIFYWADILGGKMFSYDPKTGDKALVCEGKNISGFTLNEQGGFVCASHQGVWLWDVNRGWTKITDEYEGEQLICNDATADAKGRFIFGTHHYAGQGIGDEIRLGHIFSMDSEGKLTKLDDGYGLPNGIAFSPDQKIMYVVDTFTREVFGFDYDPETGSVSNKRVVVKVPDNEGIPDGMTVDAEGCLWVAQHYGSCVVRYSPDGEVLLKLFVPSLQTTAIVFGGEDLTDMYITSAAQVARHGIAPKGYDFDAPHNGSTFRFNRGIKGMKEHIADIRL